MKIAILTGGGDAPGLNPVIRAVAKDAHENNVEMIGIKRGWAGLVELNHFPLKWEDVKNLHSEGGTFLLSSRTNPIKTENGIKIVSENLKQVADGLIAMGGEDTLGVANELYKNGVNVVGVPKTIDNDLFSTDYTIGFDTPSAFDRVYGARLGYAAVQLVLEKKWGQMLTLRGTEIKSMSLEEGVKQLKTVTNDYKDLIKQLT